MKEEPEVTPVPQGEPVDAEKQRQPGGQSSRVDWASWLKEYRPQLFPTALREARSVADAEDVLQEALMKLVQAVESGSFQGGSSGWPSYARTVIRHLAVDKGRREDTRARYLQRFRECLVSAECEYPEPWLQSSLDDERLSRRMEELLRTLPSELAEVVQLRIWNEYTFQQIADLTFTNISTVASRYRYAMRALRKRLSDNPFEP